MLATQRTAARFSSQTWRTGGSSPFGRFQLRMASQRPGKLGKPSWPCLFGEDPKLRLAQGKACWLPGNWKHASFNLHSYGHDPAPFLGDPERGGKLPSRLNCQLSILRVDSFFVLFKHRSFQKPDPFPWVSRRRFSRKKDPWKEWGR